MLSPALQSGGLIAVVLVVCIIIGYTAFGGGAQGVPMLASLRRSNGSWLVGALVVAALLLGVLGAYCPSVLPLAQIADGPLATAHHAARGEVIAEGFAVTGYDDANLVDAFTAASHKDHAIAAPFALVDNVDNPCDDRYVLRQSPAATAGTTHACRLTVGGMKGGSTYRLRVWVRTDDATVRQHVENVGLRAFDLRFTTSGYDDRAKSLESNGEVRIVTAKDTRDGNVWYLVEKAAPLTVPDDAAQVMWYVGTKTASVQLSNPVYWCGFYASLYRQGAADLPVTQGLTSFYSAFEKEESWNAAGAWLDRSGNRYNATFGGSDDTKPTYTDDGGLSFAGQLYGPPSRALMAGQSNASYVDNGGGCTSDGYGYPDDPYTDVASRENVGAFTLTFVYARETVTAEAVGVQRLLRVRADHLDRDSLANPPNYLLDIHVDHDTGELQVSQQQKAADSDAWTPVAFRVALHADVAVYTLVHDGSKGVRVYINSTEVAVEADWLDRSYRLDDRQHRLVWNEASKTVATLYAAVTYDVQLSRDQVQKLAKYLMRRYTMVGEDPYAAYSSGTRASGYGGGASTELVELRAQMATLQNKLALAENTSATSPDPSFYDGATGQGSYYDAYGAPTDDTNLQRYVGRIQSVREQLNKLRAQEAALIRGAAGRRYADTGGSTRSATATIEDLTLVKGMRVVVKADDAEAVVSTDEYTEAEVVYVGVNYVDGSEVDKRVRVTELRLHETELWRLQGVNRAANPIYCNRDSPCGDGRFCNYDRLDAPGEGVCEACESITSCDRSFHVDTKASCEAQCPAKAAAEAPYAANQPHHHTLCDAHTPCEAGSFCNYVHGRYGYCEACDVVADDLCDAEGMNKEAKRQCRKRCLAAEQKPYQYRTELTDAEYKQLTPKEKQNVLHDATWNRSVRQFEPLVSDPADGAPYPHRHESDGSVVPAATYNGHHSHRHGHGGEGGA